MINIRTTNTSNQYCQRAEVMSKQVSFAGRVGQLRFKGEAYHTTNTRFAALLFSSPADIDELISHLTILREEMKLKKAAWDKERNK